MIKAIFFDIDGTLRDFTEKGIRPGTYQAIALARNNGIRCAGIGIAMGNGNEQIKAAADFITDSIDEDGLLHAVEYLVNSSPGFPD